MLDVRSEIGRLRTVLVHEPGPEIDQMVPSMMEELLFDDILFGERAREEYGRFRRLMQVLGIEVLEIRSLVEEALQLEEGRRWILEVVADEVSSQVATALDELETTVLLHSLTAGHRQELCPSGVRISELYCITPLPNWCFQRDPQVILGTGVVFSAMATPARWREGLLARCVFSFHPRFANSPVLLDPLQSEADRALFLGARPLPTRRWCRRTRSHR
jgi:arginine deiminase